MEEKQKCECGCIYGEGSDYYFYGIKYVLCDFCRHYMQYKFEFNEGFRMRLLEKSKKLQLAL